VSFSTPFTFRVSTGSPTKGPCFAQSPAGATLAEGRKESHRGHGKAVEQNDTFKSEMCNQQRTQSFLETEAKLNCVQYLNFK